MKALIVDFETTGLAKTTKPPSDPTQPRPVSMGAVLMEEDNIIQQHYVIIAHDQPSNEKAEAIHGINQTYAGEHGIMPESAADIFECLIDQSDILVAHNLAFDRFIASCLYAQCGLNVETVNNHPGFCTMKAAKSLPFLAAANLSHVYEQMCHAPAYVSKVHNAMDDALQCAKVFRSMVRKGYGPIV